MKKLIIKIGTGNLLDDNGVVSREKVVDICRQVAILMSQGIEVVLVSSGAVKIGKDRVSLMGQNPNLAKKEFAGVGARHLLNLWGDSFETHGLEVAQVWLTYANWTHKSEYKSIRMSILSFLQAGIIPLVNENDVVSDREIMLMDQGISENDRLARMVAEMVGADAVLFLTDIGGIYDKDPRSDSSAKKYKSISRNVFKKIPKSNNKSDYGTGGINTKLAEAFLCFDQGMRVAIAGLEEDVILRFASGCAVGTQIGEVSVF